MDNIHHLPALSTVSLALPVMAWIKGIMVAESIAVVITFALTAAVVYTMYVIKCKRLQAKLAGMSRSEIISTL